MIFWGIQEDTRGEDVSKGFILPVEMLELKKISAFFENLAWDGLMFILNPDHQTLHVIALTDID